MCQLQERQGILLLTVRRTLVQAGPTTTFDTEHAIENIKTATRLPLISLLFFLYNVLTRPPIESRCDFLVFVQVLEASLRAPVA